MGRLNRLAKVEPKNTLDGRSPVVGSSAVLVIAAERLFFHEFDIITSLPQTSISHYHYIKLPGMHMGA